MKKCLPFIFAAVVLVLPGCDSENADLVLKEEAKSDSAVIYKIPSGSHYSIQSTYQPLSVARMRFKARFNSSAIYQTADQDNQADINKLYGMSDCASSHQVNSARFGWRWFKNTLEIWA